MFLCTYHAQTQRQQTETIVQKQLTFLLKRSNDTQYKTSECSSLLRLNTILMLQTQEILYVQHSLFRTGFTRIKMIHLTVC